MIDLFSPIERNAAFAARKPALRFEGATLTYGDLVRRVRGAAAALHKAGVGEGDRVAVLAYNHPDTLTLLYACAKLGAVLTPLNWRLAEDELAYAIDHAQPKQLAHGAAFAEVAQRFLPPDKLIPLEQPLALEGDGESPDRAAPEKPCLLVYTSGTTGRPKGALLSQAALVGNAIQSHHMHQMGASDHVLTVLPLFHVGGLNIQTTPALMAGATVTLTARFDPSETLRAIVDDRPTLTLLVPAAMQALAAMPGFEEANLSGLRALSTGSTIVPEALIDTFERRGVPVLSVYGATETSPIAAYDRWGEPRVKGATGRAGLLSHIKIVGPDGARLPSGTHGEIAVRGPGLSAYFRDAEATAQTLREGYIMTGDIGSLDEGGSLTVHDRKKNMLISGGENVYPAEIERVLRLHPAVSDCAVVGKPDERWQEVPVAFVVCAGEVGAEHLAAHLSGKLARFKVPRDIRLVADLPRTALGKVRHDVLRQSVAERPPSTAGAQGALASAAAKA